MFKKKIYFINNCYADTKIKNYSKYYYGISRNINLLKDFTFNAKFAIKKADLVIDLILDQLSEDDKKLIMENDDE